MKQTKYLNVAIRQFKTLQMWLHRVCEVCFHCPANHIRQAWVITNNRHFQHQAHRTMVILAYCFKKNSLVSDLITHLQNNFIASGTWVLRYLNSPATRLFVPKLFQASSKEPCLHYCSFVLDIYQWPLRQANNKELIDALYYRPFARRINRSAMYFPHKAIICWQFTQPDTAWMYHLCRVSTAWHRLHSGYGCG